MKAWQLQEVGRPLALVELPDPTPAENQVVVDIKAAGLCHSDVGFMDGTLTPILATMPIVLGHEVAGVVSALGPGVSDFAVGDRVAIAGFRSDAPGIMQDGGFAEKTIGKVEQLVPIPDAVGFEQAAMSTDAGQTSHNAVVTTGGVTAGSRVGIVGLGGLGLTAARIAVLVGAEVYASTRNQEVWSSAKELGVTEVVSTVPELEQFELDTIIDFAGVGTTTGDAVAAVAQDGKVVVVGLGAIDATISTMHLITKCVQVVGSNAGFKRDVESVLGLMASGELEVLASRIAWDEIPEGLERLHDGGVKGRLVATPD
jgi:alcohol dehydrogenase, propanol-preferring